MIKLENNNFIIFIIFIFGIFFRFYGFDTQGYWMDEEFTFYLTKPNKSYFEIVDILKYEHKVIGNPNVPPLYYYLLNKFFYVFGYYPENGRIFSVIFSSLTTVICYKLVVLWTREKSLPLFASILICLNIYIIWEAQETRPQSTVLFFSMISIYFFSKLYLEPLRKLNYLFATFFNLILLTLHPVTFAIVFSQIIFILYKIFFQNYKNNKILFYIVLSLILYLIINFNYLFSQISTPYDHFSKLSKSFFYSYHFKTFFGSEIFGAFNLLLILFLFSLNFKNLIKNDAIIFFSLIVIFAYSSTIIISILKTGLMHPRYKIYCVPIILIWITISFSYFKNYKIYLSAICIITLINTLFFIDKRHLLKPPTQTVLKKIVNDGQKNIYTFNVHWKPRYDNTLKNYKIFKKNNLILIEDINKLRKLNGYWLICANKMRSIMIFKESDPDIICDLNLKEFDQIASYKFNDYIISKFKKK